ncbi:MAG TPA: hypothetical protein VFO16_10900 [Pseudonocardiaceae bacterium]|nr:hypothetical protein [Pseudonocardiaceae bacterium]
MIAKSSREGESDGMSCQAGAVSESAQLGSDLVIATPPRAATPQLPARTVAWLAGHPLAQALVEPVWDALGQLQRADHHPGLIAALRFVLVHHQPTAAGRCRACRRVGWRGGWRRRRFPCVVWQQIRGELLGHFRAGSGGNAR